MKISYCPVGQNRTEVKAEAWPNIVETIVKHPDVSRAMSGDGRVILTNRGVNLAAVDRLVALGHEHGATILVLAQPQTPLPTDTRYPSDPGDPRSDAELASVVIAWSLGEPQTFERRFVPARRRAGRARGRCRACSPGPPPSR